MYEKLFKAKKSSGQIFTYILLLHLSLHICKLRQKREIKKGTNLPSFCSINTQPITPQKKKKSHSLAISLVFRCACACEGEQASESERSSKQQEEEAEAASFACEEREEVR